MSLAHRLNLARKVFLAYAQREPCDAARAVELADGMEEAIEKINEQTHLIHRLETDMATANENVKKALDALDTAEKTAADATQALADAKTNGILNDENTARLVAKFPDAPEPAPQA